MSTMWFMFSTIFSIGISCSASALLSRTWGTSSSWWDTSPWDGRICHSSSIPSWNLKRCHGRGAGILARTPNLDPVVYPSGWWSHSASLRPSVRGHAVSSLLCRIHGKSGLVSVKLDKSTGTKKANGKPHALKSSGEYPVQFGLALAALFSPGDLPASSPDGDSFKQPQTKPLCDSIGSQVPIELK